MMKRNSESPGQPEHSILSAIKCIQLSTGISVLNETGHNVLHVKINSQWTPIDVSC